MVVMVSVAITFFKPYLENPELFDQAIMTQALTEARNNNPNINTAEFETGYQVGVQDGQNIESIKSLTADKSESHQAGYQYGYAIACMKNNDQATCVKKFLE